MLYFHIEIHAALPLRRTNNCLGQEEEEEKEEAEEEAATLPEMFSSKPRLCSTPVCWTRSQWKSHHSADLFVVTAARNATMMTAASGASTSNPKGTKTTTQQQQNNFHTNQQQQHSHEKPEIISLHGSLLKACSQTHHGRVLLEEPFT